MAVLNGDRLPNLIIAGVPKAGTTSLFHHLSQLPDVCPSSVKEIDYFSALRAGGTTLPPISEYERFFQHCRGQRYRLEASPSYSYGGQRVREAIRRTLPGARVVLVLRDPVARLWSAYTFQKSLGRLGRGETLESFIERCERVHAEGDGSADGRPRQTALSIGFYADYVGGWLDEFGDDIRIVFAEWLFERPDTVVSELSQWLGVDPGPAARVDYRVRNRTVQPRSALLGRAAYSLKDVSNRVFRRQPGLRERFGRAYRRVNTRDVVETLPAGTREQLTTLYRQSNASTADWLRRCGYRKLPAWLEAG